MSFEIPNEDKLMVMAKHELTWQNVSDLLCSAFEGGSNYWYMIEEFHIPPELRGVPKERVFRHLDYPTRAGGSIVVSNARLVDEEGDTLDKRVTDRPRLVEALQLMAEKHPRHFSDFIREGGDADTGDVFLQLAVLGEVRYG